MTPEEIVAWALSKGWKLDRYGNLRKEWNHTLYRLMLGEKKLRYEIQIIQDVGFSEPTMRYRWKRISSAFYKDIGISEEGKLTGMVRGI